MKSGNDKMREEGNLLLVKIVKTCECSVQDKKSKRSKWAKAALNTSVKPG